MRKILVLIASLSLSCGGGIPIPQPPPEPPPEPEPCLPEIAWCSDVGQTCSSEVSPCKHNPTQDPNHCELAPTCPVEPEPPEPPPPDTNECPYTFEGLDTGVKITILRQKPNGVKILNTTGLVKNRQWCNEHGFPNRGECPPANEGLSYRQPCEVKIFGGKCATWKGQCTGTGNQCPITFDSDLAGNPWPANLVCEQPPSASAPKVFITTPEGKGFIWVETLSGLSSNKIEVDQ